MSAAAPTKQQRPQHLGNIIGSGPYKIATAAATTRQQLPRHLHKIIDRGPTQYCWPHYLPDIVCHSLYNHTQKWPWPCHQKNTIKLSSYSIMSSAASTKCRRPLVVCNNVGHSSNEIPSAEPVKRHQPRLQRITIFQGSN